MVGLEFPPISHFFVWPDVLFSGTPFGINKTVIMVLVSAALCLVIFVGGSRKRALVPTGLQNVAEASVDLIEKNLVVEVMGEEGRKWTPFMTSLFFYIFFLNIFEIIPIVQFPATSRMAIPLYLALQTWAIMIFVGFKVQGFAYLKNTLFPPGVPKALYLLVTPIEAVSVFLIRPFSLAVRLFANLFAGHLLLVVFFILTAALWAAQWYIVILPLSLFMAVALVGFELLVSVLQAYIFTILTAVYIDESYHPAH